LVCSQGSHRRTFKAGDTGYVFPALSDRCVDECFVAEFREDIRITIPAIMGRLKDSDSDVREAAIELLSTLGMCQHHFSVGMLKHVCS